VVVEAPAARSTASITRTLAAFVSSVRFADLPAAVVAKTKQHLRDGLGNQLAASRIAEPARLVHDQIEEWGGRPEATITGYGDRVPSPHAALVNAMLGHGIELDDAHGKALAKCGSVLVPATMAVGELTKASGEEMLTALVAGYDVMVRIALAVTPSHRKRGFHGTGTSGTFGAAAVGAKLLGLDEERTGWALGLAGMQAAGIQAFLDDPCLAKPFSPGKAAFNGVLAALLARKGLSGPRTVLESSEGYFRAIADEVRPGVVTDGLGEDFKVMEVGFKPHAACRYAHGPIDAAHAIREGGVSLDDVSHVTVRCSELAQRQSGRSEAPNLQAAMGSTPFSVAVALARGSNGLNDYVEAFADPRLHALARRVEMIVDKDDPGMGVAGRAADVRVEVRGGRILRHRVEGPKGEPELPLSERQLEQKFYSLAEFALEASAVETLAAELARFERLPEGHTVMNLCKATKGDIGLR
jgi:2-methylcitrate dehydratase PrpD